MLTPPLARPTAPRPSPTAIPTAEDRPASGPIGGDHGLRPDAQLPDRDRLLDPGFVADRVTLLGLAPGPVQSARLVRAKYRIGESLRAVWRCTGIDGHQTLVTVRAFAHDGSMGGAAATGALVDYGLEAAWWVFPADRRLRHVDRVMTADPALAAQLGLPSWRSTTVAEYAPERSLTVRADDGDGAPLAYLKTYAPGTVDVDRLAARYDLVAQWFAHHPGADTPRTVGTAESLLAIEAMPGRTWAATGSGADAELLRALGRAIAHLHDLPVAATTGLIQPFGRLRAERIAHSAELVAEARPDVGGPLAALATRLERRPPVDEIVPLHGDCHPKNALVAPDRLALIDLDQAGLGDPACDIASLVARLFHGSLTGEHDRARAAELARAFLAGYRQRRPLPPAATQRWHLAAVLVAERAIRAVNRLHPVGLGQLAATVDLATAALDGGLLSDDELEAWT